MTSHANSRAGSVSAVAVSRAPEANSSISPWNRARDSVISPAEKTSTSRVTTATVGAIRADRASTPRAKSLPAMNGIDTRGPDTATSTESAVVAAAVATEIVAAARSRCERARPPPTRAGSSTSNHNAVPVIVPLTPTGP